MSGGVINEHEKKQRCGHADGDCCTWLGEEVVGFIIFGGAGASLPAGRFQEVAELKFPSAKSKWSVLTIRIQPTVQVGCYATMFPSD